MNQKKVKKLRKEMKELNGFDIRVKPDYRVSKTTKKIKYFKSLDQHGLVYTKAVPVDMQCIVNIAKLPYRRLKKEFKLRSKGKR